MAFNKCRKMLLLGNKIAFMKMLQYTIVHLFILLNIIWHILVKANYIRINVKKSNFGIKIYPHM